ncbi:S9 family peptidase [Aegicerativicinus sediminis]|uniref:S9 family peptidase n=1 Tax=Aegicerativicinus sediminis TaxID=2893202 RepID=UPI001E4D00D9|nr:S9 family peptidase [Aegicerativicinus sediminis]
MIDNELKPPIAKKIPKKLLIHDDLRIDNYYWLNERENPEVIQYLEKENAYCDGMTAHTKGFQEELFQEMKARIKEDDESVPYKYNGYWYIVKYEIGKDYPIYTRKKEELSATEELLFDCNEMAIGHDYFKMVGLSVSPDNKLIAFGLDLVGRREYTLKVKNLDTGEILKDSIDNTTGTAAWANDNATIFYTKKNPITLRSESIMKHLLHTDAKMDEQVFFESDDTFGVTVYKSKSRKYLVIASFSTLTNEYRILEADKPNEPFRVFQERISGLEYSISHYKDHFYVVTNADDAFNFKLMKTPETATTKENWEDLIPHRVDTLLEDIDIFKNYLVVSERSNGLNQIKVSAWDGSQNYYLPFESETYTAYTTTNVEFDTDILRFSYNSLTTPSSIFDFNMTTLSSQLMKEQPVLGGKFDKKNYTSQRVWASARDGKLVPISMVYRKDTKVGKETPLLLYAYGSYGSTIDPYFSTVRLSLLDRGFIYAIAHIRGGEYLGRPWYEDGKMLFKKNTFNDFIDCSKHLIENDFTSSNHLYAMGGSAGGLLMGVVINEAPELYNGVVAAVPFVDVVTTMLDDSIPLTTGEYDEWGNPNEEKFYWYLKSYSPYDNVQPQVYPNMLVTAGLHDSQVQYWEPAKWVAKLREMKVDKNLLLLKTNMKAGHGGASGRFEALREDAEEFAFILDLEGINK